jgi:hypothetical protein
MKKTKKTVKKTKKTSKPKNAKVKKPATKVIEVETKIEPAVKETPKVEPIEVAKVKPSKKVKAKVKKLTTSETGLNLPQSPPYVPASIDSGWRCYLLWTAYELDYDEKATMDAIHTSIKTRFAKNKAALVKALGSIDKDVLVVKTDLKKDDYPFEPFVEAWIKKDSEEEVREKLVAIPELTIMDLMFGVPAKGATNESK